MLVAIRYIILGVTALVATRLLLHREITEGIDIEAIRSYNTFNPSRSLGFHHIYVLHLKHRIDRQQRVDSLMNYLGLDYEYFQATTGEEIENKTMKHIRLGENKWPLPDPEKNRKHSHALACFRSHMNIWDNIVYRDYQDALIFEDDIDMEADIKTTMSEILQVLPEGWDMLYLGTCVPDTVNPTHLHPKLYYSYTPGCTHAYAISNKGARKLISYFSAIWPYPEHAIDEEIIDLVRGGNVTSYSISPYPVVQIRSSSLPSDIPTSGGMPEQRAKDSVYERIRLQNETRHI